MRAVTVLIHRGKGRLDISTVVNVDRRERRAHMHLIVIVVPAALALRAHKLHEAGQSQNFLIAALGGSCGRYEAG